MTDDNKKNTFATIALALGVFALVVYGGFALLRASASINALSFLGFLSCCLWPFAGLGCLAWLGAVILAIVGLVKAAELGGKSMAIAALIVAGLSVVVMILGIAISFIIDILGI